VYITDKRSISILPFRHVYVMFMGISHKACVTHSNEKENHFIPAL